jgi:hypothetical protein
MHIPPDLMAYKNRVNKEMKCILPNIVSDRRDTSESQVPVKLPHKLPVWVERNDINLQD